MKKIRGRAGALLLLAILVIGGMLVYLSRYLEDGDAWALYFSRANSGSTGQLLDREGRQLAFFSGFDNRFAADALTRKANYHVTGDYWNRTGTGVLAEYMGSLQGFSFLTGTTKVQHSQLQLNIDAHLNNVAYEALGEESAGAVLLCNYKTGELLAMVSTPAIDPAAENIEPKEGAYINRCLSASFTPGSVFKLITAAAAMEQLDDLYERSFRCEGVYTIAGVDIKCAGVHNTLRFEDALANSCNCAFAQIAVLLGQETLLSYVKQYGFLQRQELEGFPTAAGAFPEEFVGDPETAWSGIGQSTDLICPYTMLRYVCAIANGGTVAEPRLIRDEEPAVLTPLMNPDTAEQLKGLMHYTVQTHYDGENRFPGLALCAKTGTAELGDGSSHAWFVGFLDEPEHPYAFVVLSERAGSGLTNASPIAHALLQAAVGQE